MRKRRGKGWIGEGREEKRRNKEREKEIRRKTRRKDTTTHIIQHFLLHNFFDVLYLLPGILPYYHSAFVEAFLVREFLCLCQLFSVVLTLDLQVITGLHSTQVTKARHLNDRYGFVGQRHLVTDAILFTEIL